MEMNPNNRQMKSMIRLFSFLLMVIVLVSCKKGGIPPTVETSDIINITAISATCGGTVINEGSGPVISRGVCWGAKLNPTVDDLKTDDGPGSGSYSSNIVGLYAGIAYFVRAYATNNAGTSYGITKSFIPSGQLPTVSVSTATNITATSATLNGFVGSNSSITNVTFQYGTSTAYTNTVTAVESPLAEDEAMNVSAPVTDLKASTTYHYRVIAVNSLGTAFSNDITFTTKPSKGGK